MNAENKISEANILRKHFLEQNLELQKRVQELMLTAKRDIWMCDMPADFYGNSEIMSVKCLSAFSEFSYCFSFLCDYPRFINLPDFLLNLDEKDNQITHLLDGYIDNEVNLNNDDDCTRTCPDYKVTQNFGCYKGSYCQMEEQSFARCRGTIVDCKFIESDFEICSAV